MIALSRRWALVAEQTGTSVAADGPQGWPIAPSLFPKRLRGPAQALLEIDQALRGDSDACADATGDELEEQLQRCFQGNADRPTFVAIAELLARFGLPFAPFQHMLQARNAMFCGRATTFDDLVAVTARRVHPLLRLVLHLFGVDDAERHRYGESLATALALTGFLHELDTVPGCGYLALPRADRHYFGINDDDVIKRPFGRQIKALVQFTAARIRPFYLAAAPLLERGHDDFLTTMASASRAGRRTLARLEAPLKCGRNAR